MAGVMATGGLVHSYIPGPDQGIWHLVATVG